MKAPDKQAPACAVWGVVIVCFTDEELGVDSFWEILKQTAYKDLVFAAKTISHTAALLCLDLHDAAGAV
jgi:hypothetical protein